ncbi:hypothetical protein SALBM135S_01425 [Streptomyces alboniger]
MCGGARTSSASSTRRPPGSAGLDVLVHNAGVGPISPLEDLRVDEWDDMIDVNEIVGRPTAQR